MKRHYHFLYQKREVLDNFITINPSNRVNEGFKEKLWKAYLQ